MENHQIVGITHFTWNTVISLYLDYGWLDCSDLSSWTWLPNLNSYHFLSLYDCCLNIGYFEFSASLDITVCSLDRFHYIYLELHSLFKQVSRLFVPLSACVGCFGAGDSNHPLPVVRLLGEAFCMITHCQDPLTVVWHW